MNQGKMVFAQLMEIANFHVFKYCVKRYNGDSKAKEFTCWRQFLCMAFGQLTHRESLSDTAMGIRNNVDKLYHLGIGEPFNKSTISRANESRDWRIFRDFAFKLIEEAKTLYIEDNQLDIKLKGRIFALDATVVDLCLDVFWWAKFRATKAAVNCTPCLTLKPQYPSTFSSPMVQFMTLMCLTLFHCLEEVILLWTRLILILKGYGDFPGRTSTSS